MQIEADPKLIEAARKIAPVIRDYREEAERERRLSPPVLAVLHEAGLLRMCFGRPMQATPCPGGFSITGRSPFVSNCHDANGSPQLRR
jgi:hypothetical protein